MNNLINKIHLGDCLEILKQIEDESIDLVITDPPYKIISGGVRIVNEGECGDILNKRDYSKTDPKGVLGRGRIVVSDGTRCSNKWLKKGQKDIPSAVKNGKMFEHNDIQFSEWLPEIYRVLKKGTHAYIMINSRNLKDLQIEAEKVGFVFQNLLVWDKGNLTPNKYYMQGAEFVLLLSKRPHRTINNMGTPNILKIPNETGNKQHPTQKPYELFDIFVRNSSNVGDIVLDPFAGRGTLAVSCIRNNRQYITIEKDEEYYNIAKSNAEKALGNVGLFKC